MDDLRTLRRVLHSPPPSEQATTRARELLTTEITGSTAPRPAPPFGRRRTPSPRRAWWGRGAALAGGLALSGIAAVALIAPHDPAGTSPPDADEPPPNARQILLAAAEHAAEQPATIGKYWHVRTLSTCAPVKVGTEAAPYTVVGRFINESWTSHEPGDRNWYGSLELGYRPQTAADEEAWRAAGSPTTWKPLPVPTLGKPYGPDDLFTSEPGTPELFGAPPRVAGAARSPAPRLLIRFEWDDASRLPTDPAALRTELMNRILAERFPTRIDPELRLFPTVAQLLLEAPAPPAVRAAAYRLMAEAPGATVVGEVTDAAGRTGTGIEFQRGDLRLVLIVDPSKLALLASEQYMKVGPDSFDGNTVVLAAEWTDAEPTPPKAP